LDKEAAKERLDRVDGTKADLESSPFVQLFEYGANKNGYWNYQWMVLQLEDCIDVLQALYPQFDYLFMFDHSCGHDKKRPNGLNAPNLRKGFGGSQPKMRDTYMESDDHLGTVGMKKIEVGGTQCLVFQSTDQDPAKKGKLPTSSAHLLDKVVAHRKSHRSVSHDGSWVTKLLNATKERPT
jgi:hypothetical protein